MQPKIFVLFCIFGVLIQQSNVNVNDDDDEESFHVKNFPVNFIRNFFSCNLSSPTTKKKNINSTGKKFFSLCLIRAIFSKQLFFCKCFPNSRTKPERNKNRKSYFFQKMFYRFFDCFNYMKHIPKNEKQKTDEKQKQK